MTPQRKHDSKVDTHRPSPMQLQAAYAVCRSISRSAARNFYYAFLALPKEKRDAICAVYAFMRHADDLSDEPGLSMAERRARLSDWLNRLQKVVAGEPTDDPVLLALADAQYRYAIPPALLETLVEGTLMDVDDEPASPEVAQGSRPAGSARRKTKSGAAKQAPTTIAVAATPAQLATPYETFEDLYGYCFRVASVVGLICIRIFGYKDPAAEQLAERCGIAFQLTNIIRDVKEDASIGRVYLPKEDLARFGLAESDLQAAPADLAQRFRPLLEFEAARAREYYRSADQLLPYIDEDGRPALWVLVIIYSRLLEKIASKNYDVFGDKVRLSFWDKFSVLARGVWQRIA
jgi:phytoene synthase